MFPIHSTSPSLLSANEAYRNAQQAAHKQPFVSEDEKKKFYEECVEKIRKSTEKGKTFTYCSGPMKNAHIEELINKGYYLYPLTGNITHRQDSHFLVSWAPKFNHKWAGL